MSNYPRKKVKGVRTAAFLVRTYGWTDERALRVMEIATNVTPMPKAEATEGGYVNVYRRPYGYLVEDHTGREAI